MKMIKSWYHLAFILVTHFHISYSFEPLTIGASIAIGSAGYWGFDFLKSQTYCRFNECCDERSIPADMHKLERDLKSNLFGQHIVIEKLIPALRAHLHPNRETRKPLVISFHGTPGVGKNFVAENIANALYAEGLKSKFVHMYMGRSEFPLESESSLYKMRIHRDVRDAIKDCERSLFIFDEVDKIPAGVFESLTSLVDYKVTIDNKFLGKAIFIFLSNTAGVQISDRLAKLIKSGTLREDTRLSDFETDLEKAAYNLDGGLQKASLIEAHVIDHFLPFLPLEKRHVAMCINRSFQFYGRDVNPQKIENLISEYITFDRVHNMFATSGCKTIEKKVAVYAN